MSVHSRFGAIEAGGTKVICGWANGGGEILESCRIATTTPEQVVSEITNFFLSVSRSGSIHPEGVGIGTFGPVELDQSSDRYGSILKTPKAGWQGASWIHPVRTLFPGANIAVETDVSAAALAEIRWGAAKSLEDVVYITVGTGIGAGIIVKGMPLHGLVHPEVGHMRIPRSIEDQRAFKGICPFHGDCLEGVASGPAIEARWDESPDEMAGSHPAWNAVADALAWACVNMIVTVSPRRIIIGGGVSRQRSIFPKIQHLVKQRLNGYVGAPEITEHIEEFIVPPALDQDAGIKGAVALVLPKR